jgi:hypothetical protein
LNKREEADSQFRKDNQEVGITISQEVVIKTEKEKDISKRDMRKEKDINTSKRDMMKESQHSIEIQISTMKEEVTKRSHIRRDTKIMRTSKMKWQLMDLKL